MSTFVRRRRPMDTDASISTPYVYFKTQVMILIFKDTLKKHVPSQDKSHAGWWGAYVQECTKFELFIQ